MSKVINILGVDFREREDGLYECPQGQNVSVDAWKNNDFYGMTMLFVKADGELKSAILCPDEEECHINAFNAVRSSYDKNSTYSFTQLSCDEFMYGIEVCDK